MKPDPRLDVVPRGAETASPSARTDGPVQGKVSPHDEEAYEVLGANQMAVIVGEGGHTGSSRR